MTTFWIVTSHKFVRHPSLEAAEAERARIAAKVPDKTFAVMRCKENVQPTPVFHEMLAALNNITGGMYSRELLSDEALQAAVASPEGRAAWKERCICELQEMAREVIAKAEGRTP